MPETLEILRKYCYFHNRAEKYDFYVNFHFFLQKSENVAGMFEVFEIGPKFSDQVKDSKKKSCGKVNV